MAFETIADNQIVQKGDRLLFKVDYFCPLFFCPGEGDLKAALKAVPYFDTEKVSIDYLRLIKLGYGVDVTGVVSANSIKAFEIADSIKRSISTFWRIGGVQVREIQIETISLIPEIAPKVTTTVSLVAIAVIVLVIFLGVRRFV